MRTTINLPEELVKEARKLSGSKTKTQAVVWALEELIRTKRIEHLLSMRGKLKLNIDLKKSRGR
jgi:Arc/MetJ family transcription regulator